MKHVTFILFLLFLPTLIYAQEPPEPILDPDIEEDSIKYRIWSSPLEEMPYLACCEHTLKNYSNCKACSDSTLLNYIYTNLNYPNEAKIKRIEGLLIISFSIDKNGHLDPNTVKVLRPLGSGCEESAIDLVLNMEKALGKWKPYKMNGVPLECRFNLPIRFRLKE